MKSLRRIDWFMVAAAVAMLALLVCAIAQASLGWVITAGFLATSSVLFSIANRLDR